ncbi:MAG TPA: DUF1192 domain-containing protein [Novosphingobium sp.]|nr:DUF1192 domain-containing protein [Novosphingobium sp.]
MDEDDRPIGAGRGRGDAASLLGHENLEPYSLEELGTRIHLLEAEIARVIAHRERASQSRRAAEALFRPRQTDGAQG